MRRGLALGAALLALCLFAAPAFADPAPFGRACATQNGVRFCGGSISNRVKSFDGVPLDVDVTLPPTGDGPFPTIVMLHGWGNDKTDFEASSPDGNPHDSHAETYHYNNVWFAQQGYAVVNYTARGWGDSCGSQTSRAADPAGCAKGWIHLADQRYEIRDTQYLLGLLVDEGITKPNAIGVTGISYGGGQSLELAFLHNRIRKLPSEGSGFARWTSPKGTALSITAAYARWPWSDLVESLEPNGRFLDFNVPGVRDSRDPLGIAKESYVQGLYALGVARGYYAPPGADPNADLTSWNARVLAGEPEDQQAQAIADQIAGYHQAFGLGGTPAPLLIENGWTDDLFPPEEALRVYNYLRVDHPATPVSLQLGDLGHARGQNDPTMNKALQAQASAFFDHWLKRTGRAPASGSVTAYAQVCPTGSPPSGPFTAASWPQIHPGSVIFGSAAPQTVTSDGGNQSTANTFDPIAGGTLGSTTSCTTVPAEDAQGTAVYQGPTSRGFTMMGLPTVSAHIVTTGQFGQLDSRLWDVAPDGSQTLISRGAYRLFDNERADILFQLHGNAWRFAPGHFPKLELLGRDAPYLRASNGSFSVQVSNVRVELPTLDKPGSAGGQVVASRAYRIALIVHPRRVRTGHRYRFTFFASIAPAGHRIALRGVRIRFARHSARTNGHGKAFIRLAFARSGSRTATATLRGYLSGKTKVRITRRRR